MRFSRYISTRMASRRNAQYSRLADDDDSNYNGGGQNRHDPRFDYAPTSYDKVPWKSIILAIFLLLLGCLLLLLAVFIFTGHMGGEFSQAYGLLGLGLLTFLPGVLHSALDSMKLGLPTTRGEVPKDTALPIFPTIEGLLCLNASYLFFLHI
ncbi:hypothetical protein SASPL_117487 [Salvia splendens]|uniref:Transmembrane protein 230 n=1 Tax=Salvia splendens TaxID=180675 RepID=A0A8X8ZY75_SALSN|nr:hypothetical protein SASPL_117487 [Salvia splendens]